MSIFQRHRQTAPDKNLWYPVAEHRKFKSTHLTKKNPGNFDNFGEIVQKYAKTKHQQ